MPEAPGVAAHSFLGFDFGFRRIGVSAANTITRMAAPVAVVTNAPAGIQWSAIEQLIRQLQPAALIVGQPRVEDGASPGVSAAAESFAAELASRFRLPVHRVNEFGSSAEASRRLKEARATGMRRNRVQHGHIDGAAAAIILQRWMDGDT